MAHIVNSLHDQVPGTSERGGPQDFLLPQVLQRLERRNVAQCDVALVAARADEGAAGSATLRSA